jgi:hypothetical protein
MGPALAHLDFGSDVTLRSDSKLRSRELHEVEAFGPRVGSAGWRGARWRPLKAARAASRRPALSCRVREEDRAHVGTISIGASSAECLISMHDRTCRRRAGASQRSALPLVRALSSSSNLFSSLGAIATAKAL